MLVVVVATPNPRDSCERGLITRLLQGVHVKANRLCHSIVVLTMLQVLTGCLPGVPRPDQLPREPQDPGRTEEVIADDSDRAGKREEATAHRERATDLRREAFDRDCNIVSFFFGLFIEDSLCAGPVKTENQKKYM